MISSSKGISDLLFAVGKPPIVEEHGILEEFPIDTPTGVLDAAQIDRIAEHVMQGDERLKNDLEKNGSCDCSHPPARLAPLRGDLLQQNGRPALPLRKPPTQNPNPQQPGLPA